MDFLARARKLAAHVEVERKPERLPVFRSYRPLRRKLGRFALAQGFDTPGRPVETQLSTTGTGHIPRFRFLVHDLPQIDGTCAGAVENQFEHPLNQLFEHEQRLRFRGLGTCVARFGTLNPGEHLSEGTGTFVAHFPFAGLFMRSGHYNRRLIDFHCTLLAVR